MEAQLHTGGPAAAVAPRRSGLRTLVVWLVGVGALSVLLAVPYAIASSLRLERDTVSLRDSVTGSILESGGWSRMVEIRLGGLTFGLARFVAWLTPAPNEVRQALRSARSAEVGVYQWHGGDIEATRRLMTGGPETIQVGGREWIRFVSVRDGDESVVVLTPADGGDSGELIELCVVVLADRQLVVVSVVVDAGPIADLVQPHLREVSRELRDFDRP